MGQRGMASCMQLELQGNNNRVMACSPACLLHAHTPTRLPPAYRYFRLAAHRRYRRARGAESQAAPEQDAAADAEGACGGANGDGTGAGDGGDEGRGAGGGAPRSKRGKGRMGAMQG